MHTELFNSVDIVVNVYSFGTWPELECRWWLYGSRCTSDTIICIRIS